MIDSRVTVKSPDQSLVFLDLSVRELVLHTLLSHGFAPADFVIRLDDEIIYDSAEEREQS